MFYFRLFLLFLKPIQFNPATGLESRLFSQACAVSSEDSMIDCPIYNSRKDMLTDLFLCCPLQADAMLVKNAQNLMQAVVKTLKAAEAACVKVT